MKKIALKLKEIIVSITLLIVSLPSKIFASNMYSGQDLYGPPTPLYGPPRLEPKSVFIMRIASLVLMPVAFLTGLIIYLKKSKSSKKKKVLTSLGIIVIALILMFICIRICNGLS